MCIFKETNVEKNWAFMLFVQFTEWPLGGIPLSCCTLYSTLTLPAFSSRVPMATPVSPYHSSIAPPPPTFSEPGCTCILPFPDSPIHQHTAQRRSGLAFIAPYMCHCVCRSVCACARVFVHACIVGGPSKFGHKRTEACFRMLTSLSEALQTL